MTTKKASQIVRTGTGPFRQRKSGAGTHDARTRRLRTRKATRDAAVRDC